MFSAEIEKLTDALIKGEKLPAPTNKEEQIELFCSAFLRLSNEFPKQKLTNDTLAKTDGVEYKDHNIHANNVIQYMCDHNSEMNIPVSVAFLQKYSKFGYNMPPSQVPAIKTFFNMNADKFKAISDVGPPNYTATAAAAKNNLHPDPDVNEIYKILKDPKHSIAEDIEDRFNKMNIVNQLQPEQDAKDANTSVSG